MKDRFPVYCDRCARTIGDCLCAASTKLDTPALRVGDRIKDNDPRMSTNRELTITGILPDSVYAKDGMGNIRAYLRRRIYTDGKPRRSGFSLVAE